MVNQLRIELMYEKNCYRPFCVLYTEHVRICVLVLLQMYLGNWAFFIETFLSLCSFGLRAALHRNAQKCTSASEYSWGTLTNEIMQFLVLLSLQSN